MKVLVFGTFDHLHPGHQYVFEQALKRGEVYAVVARDASVQAIKGFLPSHTQVERITAITNQYPDVTPVLGHESDYLQPVRDIQPDLILLGYDQKLPPGISETELPCPVERLDAFEPEKWKSSLLRGENSLQ